VQSFGVQGKNFRGSLSESGKADFPSLVVVQNFRFPQRLISFKGTDSAMKEGPWCGSYSDREMS